VCWPATSALARRACVIGAITEAHGARWKYQFSGGVHRGGLVLIERRVKLPRLSTSSAESAIGHRHVATSFTREWGVIDCSAVRRLAALIKISFFATIQYIDVALSWACMRLMRVRCLYSFESPLICEHESVVTVH